MAAEMTAWVGVGIGAGSLMVAVIAFALSKRSADRVSRLQERIVHIEEQREERQLSASRQANLKAELRRPTRNSERLYIVNSGQAEARNIRVELDAKPLAEHPAAVSNDHMPRAVGANNDISCFLAIRSGITPPFDVKITWDDDYAEGRSYSTTLTW